MNTKNNKRRRESVERIRKSFLEYLKTKDITQISVSDICKKAEINRSTFYSSFTDIYDLADRIQAELEDEVNRLWNMEIDWNKSKNDFLKLFEHIKENQDLYLFYFKLGYENKNLKFYDIYDIKEFNGTDMLDYHIEFFKNGLNAIIRMWLEKGCKESPQQMCDILLFEYRGRFENQ